MLWFLTSFGYFTSGGFTDAAVGSGDDERAAGDAHLQIRRVEASLRCLITASDERGRDKHKKCNTEIIDS